tara:strand:- start:15 stop:329 length:315 start_codon:yes stop_codon:yes gene_type:complete
VVDLVVLDITLVVVLVDLVVPVVVLVVVIHMHHLRKVQERLDKEMMVEKVDLVMIGVVEAAVVPVELVGVHQVYHHKQEMVVLVFNFHQQLEIQIPHQDQMVVV